MASQAALQGVQVPAWAVHVLGSGGSVERGQLARQARGVDGLNTRSRTGSKESLDALVPEASDHRTTVARGATRCNLHRPWGRRRGKSSRIRAGGDFLCEEHLSSLCALRHDGGRLRPVAAIAPLGLHNLALVCSASSPS